MIFVVTHKPYDMPSDPVYLPIQVGTGDDLGFARDNTGDNIADKNPHYCELTALYWAWKNLPPDVESVGLAHYRRHFTGANGIVTGAEVSRWLDSCAIILPKKRHYWIETTWSQYAHAHHEADLQATRQVIEARCPAFLMAFDAVMKRTSGHRFNMFIMRRDILDAYCTWLFDILFEVERRLDISAYSPYNARVFGFVGERLLDVWIEGTGQAYKDVPYRFMEKQNWVKKGGAFLRRKVRG